MRQDIAASQVDKTRMTKSPVQQTGIRAGEIWMERCQIVDDLAHSPYMILAPNTPFSVLPVASAACT